MFVNCVGIPERTSLKDYNQGKEKYQRQKEVKI